MFRIRVDKFLKNSRIIKRRTVSKMACDQGRVSINDRQAKAGDSVKIGDIIEVKFGTGSVRLEVTMLEDNPSKNDAATMYRLV